MISENTTEDMAETNIAESLLHNVEARRSNQGGDQSFHLLKGAAIVGSIFLFMRGYKFRRHPRWPVAADVSGLEIRRTEPEVTGGRGCGRAQPTFAENPAFSD